tara:strand:- start:2905 stop:3765 length:861 start_codon:yes stop_codon:yes gene_type:complete
VTRPIPKKISQILPTFQNVAQTSNYYVQFALPTGAGSGENLRTHLQRKGVDMRFHTETIGLLCSSASLPGSSHATVNAVGEHQGMVEKMAHTKNFTVIDLEFYVDNDYKSLKFLEHWLEYISDGGTSDPLGDDNYHFRMRYPKEYKSYDTKILKFEKNYRQYVEYTFKGLFPLSLNSTQVSYQNSQVLKASATFSYDRHVAGGTSSAQRDRGVHLNNKGTEKFNAYKIDPKDLGTLTTEQAFLSDVSILNSGANQDIAKALSNTNYFKDPGPSQFSWKTISEGRVL